MKDPFFYVSSLLELHRRTVAERRVLFRQAMATLSRAKVDGGPGPLEGLNPEALLAGVRSALASGLFEDLEWLAPPAAGRALYALAAALPLGPEQRDLGRRVVARLFAGNAETFAAMATVMALSGGKGLAAPAAASRIALVVELPLMQGVADGALALALISRREFAREWIIAPSTRSLPARRLAARLLERAAREAAKRASQGDPHALRIFRGDWIQGAFGRLLADRESLVWRHVAVARGLIAPWMPEVREELENSLSLELSPTEWRRGATSIAALGAVHPEDGERLASRLLRGKIVGLEPGVAQAFAWGLPRVAESEPEAASQLLGLALRAAPEEVAETIPWLHDELGASHFYDEAALRTIATLTRGPFDDAIRRELVRTIEGRARSPEPLGELLARALAAFADEGAQQAHARGLALLEASKVAISALDALPREREEEPGEGGEEACRQALAVLRDVDLSLLERSVLGDLLRLDTNQERVHSNEASLEGLRDHVASWILAREFPSPGSPPSGRAFAVGPLRLARVRALLHLVDGDSSGAADDPSQAQRHRARWRAATNAVLGSFDAEPAPGLRRVLLATLARALDALVRAEVCEVADAFLVVADTLRAVEDFDALAEASMDPDLRHVLVEYARFLRALVRDRAPSVPPRLHVGPLDSLFPSPAPDSLRVAIALVLGKAEGKRIAALGDLASELVSEGAARTEALRNVLVRLHGVLALIGSARALRGMGGSDVADAEVLQNLESSVGALVQLIKGARSRIQPPGSGSPRSETRSETRATSGSVRLLSLVVGRVLSGAEARLRPELLAAALDDLTRGLPRPFADLVLAAGDRLAALPVETRREGAPPPSVQEMLPAWVPARRVLGAFYIVRQLGVGGAGSVFVAHRLEDRNDPSAERFALKVPDYDEGAARSLSEAEFLAMFRSEASALVALPSHPNLARFVTFDLAARPKPILVMELVEGLTLELAVQSLALDMRRAFRALDDVLSGLSVMHEAGLGHLDVKPSNVVLRRGEVAVLVDFGLAGRKVRPGCASGAYGAPEIWAPSAEPSSPMAADVYAFGCLAFETLVGELLFDADEEVSLLSAHLVHDGYPPKLERLASVPGLSEVVALLGSTLRKDPGMRITVPVLRKALAELGSELAGRRWPVKLPP